MFFEDRLDVRALSSLSFAILLAYHLPLPLECPLLPSRLLIIEEPWIADRSLTIGPSNVHGLPVEILGGIEVSQDKLLCQQVAGKKAVIGAVLKPAAIGEKLAAVLGLGRGRQFLNARSRKTEPQGRIYTVQNLRARITSQAIVGTRVEANNGDLTDHKPIVALRPLLGVEELWGRTGRTPSFLGYPW